MKPNPELWDPRSGDGEPAVWPFVLAAIVIVIANIFWHAPTAAETWSFPDTLGRIEPSNSFIVVSSDPIAIVIHPDGRVDLPKNQTLDESSAQFWKAVQAMGMKMACSSPGARP